MKKISFVTVLLAGCLSANVYASEYYVDNIKIDGIKRVEEETVLAYLGVKTDKNVSQDKLDSALKNLYSTGLFSDIQMEKQVC